MPGRDGADLAETLRRLSPGLPIAILTGYANSPLIPKPEKSGVAVFTKPVIIQELLEFLRPSWASEARGRSCFRCSALPRVRELGRAAGRARRSSGRRRASQRRARSTDVERGRQVAAPVLVVDGQLAQGEQLARLDRLFPERGRGRRARRCAGPARPGASGPRREGARDRGPGPAGTRPPTARRAARARARGPGCRRRAGLRPAPPPPTGRPARPARPGTRCPGGCARRPGPGRARRAGARSRSRSAGSARPGRRPPG